MADTLNGPLIDRLSEALRLLLEGVIPIPYRNPVDGPEHSTLTAGFAVIGAAYQISDRSLREKTLQLGGELISKSGIENVSVDISAVA